VTTLFKEEIEPRIDELITTLFEAIPSGLGSKGPLRLSEKELNDVFFGGQSGPLIRDMETL